MRVKKARIGKEDVGDTSEERTTTSYNIDFGIKKENIGQKNGYFRTINLYITIGWLGPTPFKGVILGYSFYGEDDWALNVSISSFEIHPPPKAL